MMEVSAAQLLIRKTKRAARRSGQFGLRWGCVIGTSYHDDEGPVLRLTTQGGECVWLTGAMLRAVQGDWLFLAGHTQTALESWHVRDDEELVDHLWMTHRHQPTRCTDREILVVNESQYQAGTLWPAIFLSTARPRAWPL
ncbi:MAG TPA: hypothetical protein VLK84_17595 [Longimicrobium sp.]|nr:hypothetical protein [Longimicrobium sp.]